MDDLLDRSAGMSTSRRETHAILGAGGVGGLVGAVLASAGARVILLLRPAAIPGYPDHLTLESPLGNVSGPVKSAGKLEDEVDVLWVTTKATSLAEGLEEIPDPSLAGLVVPLLNGVDHIALLRSRFGADRVIPGTIACEVERVAPGRIVQRSPFARLAFAAAGEVGLSWASGALSRFGCECRFDPDERTLLWKKLVMLAPMALTTTASGLPLGEVRDRPELAAQLEAAAREACAVARAEGAQVDAGETVQMLRNMPAALRSSMQKDVAAGRAPELDAIAGPILRGGRAHGIAVPTTAELSAIVAGYGPAGH